MELVGHNLQLTLYRRLMFGVLLGVMVIVAGALALTRLVQPPTNPFSAFSDLFGSDARQAALARGFTCQDMMFPSHTQTLSSYCAQRNTDKMFSGIFLRMSGNTTREISFSLRDNTLTLGDLASLWGEPAIRLYCETVVASWPAHRIVSMVAPSRTGHFSYFLPIISVSFTRSGTPQWGRLLMNDVLHHCE